MTPCMHAVYCGFGACLRALVEGAARQEGRTLDVNAVGTGGVYKDRTALDVALGGAVPRKAMAAYLRELGALRSPLTRLGIVSFEGDQAGKWPGMACHMPNFQGVEYELRKAVEDGADVNAAVFDCCGKIIWNELDGPCTATYLAASLGRCDVLGVLLAAPISADPDKGETTGSKMTPCHIACESNNPGAVTLLLAHGADPNFVDEYGWTPCMSAAAHGSTASLRALAAGAAVQEGRALDVNAVHEDDGRTALDIALSGDVSYWPEEEDQARSDLEEAAACLRDELGALTGRVVRRRRVCRAAVRELLHRRAAEWLLHKYAAAKARVDFAPGGAGAQKAAAEFASVAASEAAQPPAGAGAGAGDERPRKRARTDGGGVI